MHYKHYVLMGVVAGSVLFGSVSLAQQPKPQPKAQAGVWRRVAILPTNTEQKGTGWKIVINNGAVFYEEIKPAGICSITVTFAEPPAEIRAKDPPFHGLVVQANAVAKAGVAFSGFVTARYWSDLVTPHGLVAWEGDYNQGMTAEDAKLAGCQSNDPKKGRSTFTVKLIDNPPERFEIRTFIGANNLVARYVYLKDQ